MDALSKQNRLIYAGMTISVLASIFFLFTNTKTTTKTVANTRRKRKKGTKPRVVKGLKNIGNTCFLNSILQSFASCEDFSVFLRAIHEAIPEDRFLTVFLDVVEGRSSDPTEFHAILSSEVKQFEGFRQQDAHELYNACIEILERKMSILEHDRFMHNVFGSPLVRDPSHGLFGSVLVCKTCGHGRPYLSMCIEAFCKMEVVYEVVCDLCSIVNTRASPEEQNSLQTTKHRMNELIMMGGSSLHSYSFLEEEKKQNTPVISMSKDPLFAMTNTVSSPQEETDLQMTVKTSKYKCMVLGRLPRVLVFHLNRLLGDLKLEAHVKFPLFLDMQRFYSPFSYDNDLAQANSGMHTRKQLYELQSVVVHHGGAYSGHFTCFRRKIDVDGEATWVNVSDSSVREVHVDAVLSSQAYMLFYEKKEHSK